MRVLLPRQQCRRALGAVGHVFMAVVLVHGNAVRPIENELTVPVKHISSNNKGNGMILKGRCVGVAKGQFMAAVVAACHRRRLKFFASWAASCVVLSLM
eukprot:scaffold6655_cov169-Amphora_coffeaeformis.AAC.9